MDTVPWRRGAGDRRAPAPCSTGPKGWNDHDRLLLPGPANRFPQDVSSHAHDRRPCVVFAGGLGLGAYHGGVIEAFVARGGRLDCVTGASAGAITAVLITGSAPDARRQFKRLLAGGAHARRPLAADSCKAAPEPRRFTCRATYRPGAEEAGPAKSLDLSAAALDERWRAGSLDTQQARAMSPPVDGIQVVRRSSNA
ncbi:patatin-like phospholipase family protein [Bradyrhizobium aeschynomenes]|uniref:patatin-like phospholipase family protein n=1 Tax=Bradyrhizobium aeschynomenes TaxID=2734909 RepID=UPI001FEEE7CD|nr:patatin-like phospholipase family protein [Bradyrhizobium aeschynomenes]